MQYKTKHNTVTKNSIAPARTGVHNDVSDVRVCVRAS